MGLPVFSFFLIVGFSYFWLFSAIMLYSCGEASPAKNQFPFA
jgi:hypothetical protein